MLIGRFLSIVRPTCLRTVCLQRTGGLSAPCSKDKRGLSTLKVQPGSYRPSLDTMQPASVLGGGGGAPLVSGVNEEDEPAGDCLQGQRRRPDGAQVNQTLNQGERLNMEVQKDHTNLGSAVTESPRKMTKTRMRREKRKQTNKKLNSNATSENLMSELPFALTSPTTWKALGFPSPESTQKKRKRGDSGGRVDSEEDGEEKKKKKKEHQRPNYFVSIPITNKQISTAVAEIQEAVLQQEPRLAKAMIPIATLHITLLVTHLATQEQVDLAATMLAQVEPAVAELLGGRDLVLPFTGISHFRKEVVFLGLASGQHRRTLDNLADFLRSRFEENGLLQGDCRGFEPHLTIMKLSRASKLRSQGHRVCWCRSPAHSRAEGRPLDRMRVRGIKRVEPALYSDYSNKSFGDETVERVDLCSMLKKKQPDGYYHTETSIQLGGRRRSQPDEAELLRVSRRLVEDAINRAMQQYKQETLQNGGGPNAATMQPPGSTEDTMTKTDTTANSTLDNRV